jgi:predicted RNA-binding Zn-ribbon protein involved in translation (DUF1610 family)
MGAKAREAFRVGVFAVVCTTVVLSSVGCRSSGVAVSPTNPMCPICGGATQAQPTAGASGTKAVCPICGEVAMVDQDFLTRLEIFTGGPVGDTVYACAMCGTIVQTCATCRQKGYGVNSQNTRGWQ